MYKVGDLVRNKKTNEVLEIGLIVEGFAFGKELDWLISINQIEPVTHLTTKEFVKVVEDMGYRTDEWTNKIVVYRMATISSVSKINLGVYRLENVSEELFKLFHIYTNTPLELREEKEKLYTLELPNTGNEYRYYAKGKTEYMFDDIDGITGYQKIFTQKEIDELPNQELIKTLINNEVKEN